MCICVYVHLHFSFAEFYFKSINNSDVIFVKKQNRKAKRVLSFNLFGFSYSKIVFGSILFKKRVCKD